MRIAAGLILAGAISLAVPGAAWSQARHQGRGGPASGSCGSSACCSGARRGPSPCEGGLRQSRRAWDRPHRRNRHHRRTRIRFRALQAARFPARQGSGADLRRRPVAGQHALDIEDAGGRMHHRHFLFDRQARDLLSGNPEAGSRGRPHHRIAHLVACDADQQETDRRAAQGRDRKRLQRGEVGAGRRFAGAVLPLSRPCSIRRKW